MFTGWADLVYMRHGPNWIPFIVNKLIHRKWFWGLIIKNTWGSAKYECVFMSFLLYVCLSFRNFHTHEKLFWGKRTISTLLSICQQMFYFINNIKNKMCHRQKPTKCLSDFGSAHNWLILSSYWQKTTFWP